MISDGSLSWPHEWENENIFHVIQLFLFERWGYLLVAVSSGLEFHSCTTLCVMLLVGSDIDCLAIKRYVAGQTRKLLAGARIGTRWEPQVPKQAIPWKPQVVHFGLQLGYYCPLKAFCVFPSISVPVAPARCLPPGVITGHY